MVSLASPGAPMPVSPVGFGDPAVLERSTATLLLHARVEQQDEGRRILLFTLRVFRTGGVETQTLFGAAPRSVPLNDPQAVDAAIDAALAQTLPWRAQKPVSSSSRSRGTAMTIGETFE